MWRIILLFLLIFNFSSCSENSENSDLSVSKEAFSPKAKKESTTIATPNIPQKIIKEAFLKFETNNLEDTSNQIQKIIKENGATVQTDSERKNYNSIYRNLVIRVPSQNFDAFISNISKGISYFEQKDISAQDVTEQYIDLTSRLNTKRKLENRYLEILKKANKISEILEIEKQISNIREEIEAKEGQLKYLENKVSESTVTIEFYKTIAEKENIKISYGSKIINAIKTGFYEISSFFISLISIWPFILLFLIIAYFIKRRKSKRKKI